MSDAALWRTLITTQRDWLLPSASQHTPYLNLVLCDLFTNARSRFWSKTWRLALAQFTRCAIPEPLSTSSHGLSPSSHPCKTSPYSASDLGRRWRLCASRAPAGRWALTILEKISWKRLRLFFGDERCGCHQACDSDLVAGHPSSATTK